MNLNALENITFTVAQAEGVDSVVRKVVRRIAGDPAVALARIWLVAPGDICAACSMQPVCPDRARCLHLVASAGNPLISAGNAGTTKEDSTRLNGHFQRIPLSAHFNALHFPTSGEPCHLQIEDGGVAQHQFDRPEWVKSQKIRSFTGHPLVSDGEVLGVLAVFNRAELSKQAHDSLRILADRIAEAVSSARARERGSPLDARVAGVAQEWRAVFKKSAIGVALTDENGRFLDVNPAYEKMLGYTRTELRSLSFFDVTPEEFRDSNLALTRELWEGKIERYQFEKPYLRKDGGLIWVRVNASLVPGEGDEPLCCMAFCEDITERKRAEQALQKSEARWRTLLEINNAIITKLNPKDLFHAICKALEQVIPFGRVALILHEPSTDVLRLAALEGPYRGTNFAVGTEVGPDSVSRWVFNHCRPLLRKDLEAEWQYPTEKILLAEGIRSLCTLPLVLREKPFGVLFVGSATKGQYAESDVSFLQEVANQIVLAIGNMEAYEKIRDLNLHVARTADRLRTLLDINNAIITNLSQDSLLHAIGEALHRVVPFERAAVTLYLPDKDVFRFVAIEGATPTEHFRPGLEMSSRESSVGWVFHQQRPIVRRDLEKEQQFPNEQLLVRMGMRSHCVVPLVARGKAIGTLNVASSVPNQYSEDLSGFLQEVAKQVALAIENMRSYEEIAKLKARLQEENVYLQEEIRSEHNFEDIVGNSPALMEVLQDVERVAPTDSTVLIYGETGTGKELIARAIHSRSARKNHPLLRVDCSAIPAGLVESELFGHMKGAFTGAFERRTGRFELADGGTVFLDEIGELPPEIQAKLLRVLQEHEFEPVGSSQPLRVDVRVIAATNRKLEDEVKEGRFRADLFYRLNVFPLNVPPLRERPSDIPQLVMFYLARSSKKSGKRVENVSQETMDRLVNYTWPGNVRELQNVIERAVILSPGSTLVLDRDLTPGQSPGTQAQPSERPEDASVESVAESPRLPTLEEVERLHILAALEQTGGVIEGPKGAAKILNLHPNTLRNRLHKLGIPRPRHHPR